MKVALVIAANIWAAPYIKIYEDLFRANDIQYDIISWNRDLTEEYSPLSWNHQDKKGKFFKLIEYYLFTRFVRGKLNNTLYDKIVIFGEVVPIYLCHFLKKKFLNKYIVDLRDLGIEQYPLFKRIFSIVVKNSLCNVVSSNGFIKYLPKSKYIISHNFDLQQAEAYLQKKKCVEQKEIIDILTIGQIRNYDANLEMINALKNNKHFLMRFVGQSPVANRLQKYVKDNDILNVSFSGYYKKEHELEVVKSCTIMNLYMPKIKSHASLMSNRFYNALFLAKPMIATAGSVQAELVEKYKLGITVNDCDNLACKIEDFMKTNDFSDYDTQSNILIKRFIKETLIFQETIINKIKSNK